MERDELLDIGKYRVLEQGKLTISRLREPVLQNLLAGNTLSAEESGYLKALSDIEDVILEEVAKITKD